MNISLQGWWNLYALNVDKLNNRVVKILKNHSRRKPPLHNFTRTPLSRATQKSPTVHNNDQTVVYIVLGNMISREPGSDVLKC